MACSCRAPVAVTCCRHTRGASSRRHRAGSRCAWRSKTATASWAWGRSCCASRPASPAWWRTAPRAPGSTGPMARTCAPCSRAWSTSCAGGALSSLRLRASSPPGPASPRTSPSTSKSRCVTVEQDDSPGARRLLYAMYERTARRQGFVLRHKSYFLDAWDAMVEAGYAHLFFACHGGRPLAALLAHTFGPKVWYHVGASEDEGRNVMPAHALQFHVIQWAQQRGLTYYDLVAIPNAETVSTHDSMWNLYVFKSGFGGRPVEWVCCLDRVLDPRGHAWEACEPA